MFFCDDDKQLYLEWLYDYCAKYDVTMVSYCLMDNHLHLILTPSTEDGLFKVFKPLHMRYAQYINKRHNWSGRFFSSALDETHTYAAIRYVERNPVDAGMMSKAEDYLWSSAGHHCSLSENKTLSNHANQLTGISVADWSDWLSRAENKVLTDMLEHNIDKGLPCGDDRFISILEKLAQQPLWFRAQGGGLEQKRVASPLF